MRRAAHSSSALAVNGFGPFKRHLSDHRIEVHGSIFRDIPHGFDVLRNKYPRRSSKCGWFQEMLRLIKAPKAYTCLDAAQLVTHALGPMRCFPHRRATLLYLYWEPDKRVSGHRPVWGELDIDRDSGKWSRTQVGGGWACDRQAGMRSMSTRACRWSVVTGWPGRRHQAGVASEGIASCEDDVDGS